MTTKNEIVSSLRIEPVNTDEYNQNLVKQLASHHKRKFLECIRNEHSFLHGKRYKSIFFNFHFIEEYYICLPISSRISSKPVWKSHKWTEPA